jgi:hypothetical protein
MRKSRFSEEQIIGCYGSRRRGKDRGGVPAVWISTTTFHKWKARYGF